VVHRLGKAEARRWKYIAQPPQDTPQQTQPQCLLSRRPLGVRFTVPRLLSAPEMTCHNLSHLKLFEAGPQAQGFSPAIKYRSPHD
jgi:hypothetical protein